MVAEPWSYTKLREVYETSSDFTCRPQLSANTAVFRPIQPSRSLNRWGENATHGLSAPAAGRFIPNMQRMESKTAKAGLQLENITS